MVHLQQTSCASEALEGWSGQNKTSEAASVIDGAKLQSCANVFGTEANILSDAFTLNTEMRGSPLGNHAFQTFRDSSQAPFSTANSSIFQSVGIPNCRANID